MPSATDAFDKLLQIPETRRLLEIARSDNPLIALAVTKREISWTQFQAWLLDPVRHPGPLGSRFLEALLTTALPDIGKAIDRGKAADLSAVHHLETVCSPKCPPRQAERGRPWPG